ncbi:MAG: hypothetical protein V4503_01735 [Gemmatimonadota bacterium]
MVSRLLRALTRWSALVVMLTASRWHPVHAARIELVSSGANVTATVRVYHDDFPPRLNREDVTAYLARTLILKDQAGVTVPLTPSAIVPEGDRVRIVLKGTANGALGNGHLAVTVLQERFSDQVNVALALIDGRRAQLVYLRGDAAQVLP